MERTSKPKALLATALVVLAVAAWSTVQAQGGGSDAEKVAPSDAPAADGNQTGGGEPAPEAPHNHSECKHDAPRPGAGGHNVSVFFQPPFQAATVGPGGTANYVFSLIVNSSQQETVIVKHFAGDSTGVVGKWSHRLNATGDAASFGNSTSTAGALRIVMTGKAELRLTVMAPLVPSPTALSYKVGLVAYVEGEGSSQASAAAVTSIGLQ